MMYQNHGTGRGKSLPQDLITANLRFLVAQLEAGHSEVLTQYLNAMARFHNYSFGNVLLIARQRPSSTHVAGIRTWNSLGRFVKKGEPGIMILVPLIRRQRRQEETITAEPNSDRGTCDSEKELIPQLAGFRRAFVWDRLSRDLWPSLCALDVAPGWPFQSVPSIAAATSSLNSCALSNAAPHAELQKSASYSAF